MSSGNNAFDCFAGEISLVSASLSATEWEGVLLSLEAEAPTLHIRALRLDENDLSGSPGDKLSSTIRKLDRLIDLSICDARFGGAATAKLLPALGAIPAFAKAHADVWAPIEVLEPTADGKVLPQGARLCLMRNNIADADLGSGLVPLLGLLELNLSGNPLITDAGLGTLAKLVPNVRRLFLSRTGLRLADGGARLFTTSWRMLEALSLHGSALTTDGFEALRKALDERSDRAPKTSSGSGRRCASTRRATRTSAATGKGFAIGSAVLTALSLLAAFKEQIAKAGAEVTYDVADSIVLAGVLTGAMLPYLFAALTMISVGKAAAEIINEVREQFKSHKNGSGFTLGQCIRLYKEKYDQFGEGNWKASTAQEVVPDSDRCVAISTLSAVREMIAPGSYAVLAPLIGGFLVGPRFLVGMLAGAVASGCMLAIMMANAGGAWDNSKKLCEKLGLKKSKVEKERQQQKACVVGDTVGDPFKDTSGPALNILIKLMSMVSLTVSPLLAGYTTDFQFWYYGLVPLLVAAILTFVLSYMKILTWDDPLAGMLATPPAPKGKKAMV